MSRRQSSLGIAIQGHTDDDHDRHHGCQQEEGQGRADEAGAGLTGKTVGQNGELRQQDLGVLEDVTGSGTNLEEVGRSFKDRINVLGNEFEQLVYRLQAVDSVFIGYPGDAHGGVAVKLTVQYPAKQAGVTAETVSGDNRVFVTGQYVVDRTHDTLCQQRLALCQGDLLRRSVVVQQDLYDVIVLHLQLGNGFVQGPGYFVQAKYRIPGRQDAVGVVPNGVPVLLNATALGHFTGRQAGGRITF